MEIKFYDDSKQRSQSVELIINDEDDTAYGFTFIEAVNYVIAEETKKRNRIIDALTEFKCDGEILYIKFGLNPFDYDRPRKDDDASKWAVMKKYMTDDESIMIEKYIRAQRSYVQRINISLYTDPAQPLLTKLDYLGKPNMTYTIKIPEGANVQISQKNEETAYNVYLNISLKDLMQEILELGRDDGN